MGLPHSPKTDSDRLINDNCTRQSSNTSHGAALPCTCHPHAVLVWGVIFVKTLICDYSPLMFAQTIL